MESSSSYSASFAAATEELRAGVEEPCFWAWALGAGVLLARLEDGVPLRGRAGVDGMLSALVVSILRFFAAGFFMLAVPFLGAARFFVGVALGFSEFLLAGISIVAEG